MHFRHSTFEQLEPRLAMDATTSVANQIDTCSVALDPTSEWHNRLKGEVLTRPITEVNPFASKWQNTFITTDANRDGAISSLDVLVVINELNGNGARALNISTEPENAVDVNGDGYVTPLDVLGVLNELNRPARDSAIVLAQQSGFYSQKIQSVVPKGDSPVYTVLYCTPISELALLGQRSLIVTPSSGSVERMMRE